MGFEKKRRPLLTPNLSDAMQDLRQQMQDLQDGVDGAVTLATKLDFELTEQDTGEKWVDNSPIYRKTITGALGDDGVTEIATGFPSVAGYTVVGVVGVAINGSNDTQVLPSSTPALLASQISLSVAPATDPDFRSVWINNTGSDMSSYTAYVHVSYIKP